MQRNAYSTALGQGASMDCSKVWVRVTALFDRTGSRPLHRPGVATDGGRLGFQRRLRLNFEEQETATERLGYGEQVEKIEKGFQQWLVGWRLRFGTGNWWAATEKGGWSTARMRECRMHYGTIADVPTASMQYCTK